MRCYPAILLFLVFFGPAGLSAQENHPVTNFTTADGLPSTEVYHVFEDRNQYLWFTTDRGISRYNGYEFENFNSFNANLSSNTVFKAHEAPNGDLWFTCYDGSIMIYRMQTNRFEAFEFNREVMDHIEAWIQQVFFIDNKVYLIPLRCTKVLAFDFSTHALSVLKPNEFFDVYDPDGMFTHNGYRDFCWPHLNLPTMAIPGPKEYYVTKKGLIINDTCYFLYNNYLYGKFNKTVFQVSMFDEDIHYLYADKENNLFVMTANAVYKAPFYDHNKPLISGYSFSSMCRDRDGNYWFSTLEKGILKLPALLCHQYELPSPIKTHEKTTAMCLYNDYLLIGTSKGHIYSMSPDIQTTQLIIPQETSLDYIKNLYADKEAAYASGGVTIRFGNHKFSQDKMEHFELSMLLSNDSLLLIPPSPGFALGSISTSGVLTFRLIPSMNERILCITKDQDNNYWFGTHYGVWKITRGHFDHPEKISGIEALGSRINDICIVDSSLVLFATIGNGLVLFNEKSNTAESIGTKEGLCSNMVHSLARENDSIFWAGTNNGIGKVKLVRNAGHVGFEIIQNINTTNGLLSNYVNDLLIWHDKLWIASDIGLFSFNYLQYHSSDVLPKLSFTGLWIADSNYLRTNEFSHAQNDIIFTYEGICYKKPKDNFYRYRLLGNHRREDWIYTNNRSIAFNDLTPGNYTFEVSARNSSDNWADTLSYGYVIQPHFTQTWWFKTLMVLLGVGLVLSFIRWRLVEIRQQEQKSGQIRELELSMLRSQMNPHFVFNALNSVQNFMVNRDIPTAMAYLGKFSLLMRNSLNFSRQKFISVRDEVQYIRNYLEVEQVRFPDRFSYHIDVPPSLEDCENHIPPLLIQPLLENAIKHAFPDDAKKGNLTVALTENAEENLFKWTICDNGVGIYSGSGNKQGKHVSKGLKIVRERIELMNGKEKKGSFQITDLGIHENGTGTRIEISLPIIN